MRLNDAVWGALLLLLGMAILVAIRSFPTIPGQQYGPALFPGVIAVGLLLCGAALVYTGLAARERGGIGFRALTWDEWTRSPRHVLAFGVVIAVNVLYIAFADRLGFVIASSVYLAALFAVFGVRRWLIVPLAIAVTLVIHYAFYKLLRVPLPWGVLQGIAW